jgi:CheY-like chemotaxis protein
MPHHILVIDDHPETLKVVSLILRRYGYEVATVDAGLKGIAAAERQRPDLILLDVMMPGLDGYEVCRRFRAHSDLLKVPIIMFTAKSQIDEKWAGFQAGADDYLVKPTDPEELAARIEALLSRPASATAATRRQTAVPITLSTVPEPDPQPPFQQQRLAQQPVQPAARDNCVVAVIGARGGAGATTVALNMASIMAGTGHATILVDLDMHQGHVALYLKQKVRHSINQWANLEGQPLREALSQNVVQYRHKLELVLTRPNFGDHLPVLSVGQVASLVEALKRSGRCILADLGSGAAPLAPQLLRHFSHILVCLQPDRVGMGATQLLLRQLQKQLQPPTALHILILDFGDGAQLPAKAVAEFLRHPVTATIPLDRAELAQAVNRSQLLVDARPDSQATAAFCRLAGLLLQQIVPQEKKHFEAAKK